MLKLILLILTLVLISGQTFDPNRRSPRITLSPGAQGANVVATDRHQACSEANLSLGMGWTLVDCAAESGQTGSQTVTLGLVHSQAVPSHALVVVFVDANQAGADQSGTMNCSDNAGNTFTQAPMGYAPPYPDFGQGSFLIKVSYWYVLDSNAKASGYQASCTFTTTGGTSDMDMSIMVFKQDSGLPSSGIDSYIPWKVGNSALGTCPCEMVPGGQTITVSRAGVLVLGGGNMNAGYLKLDAPFVGADGDGSYSGPAYYTAVYASRAPGVVPTFHWYTDSANVDNASSMFSFHP